ncbi:MAG: hypothetical protein ABI588_11380 [Arenimonas sp.]
MAEAVRPLTLLLGGACLWALCLLILALGGLGTRFPAPAAVAPPPPLPVFSLTAARSRLGAFDAYAEVGARPLLNEKRKPIAISAIANDANAGELDVTLSSVLITSRLRMAIFTDNKDGSSRRARMDELLDGSNWRLVELAPRSAVLEGPEGRRTLELRVFDGANGEAPTPVVAAGSDAESPSPPPATPAPPARKPEVAQNASPAATVSKPDPNAMTQEQQVEAIRARIEARRAQMRAEAEAAAANNR